MRQEVDKFAQKPKDKLLTTFDFLESWFKDSSFYGCPFMSAASEYGEELNPVFQKVVLHKRLLIAYFEELTRAANLGDVQRIAEEINLLHEGATAVAHITGTPETAQKTKAVASRIIDAATNSTA